MKKGIVIVAGVLVLLGVLVGLNDVAQAQERGLAESYIGGEAGMFSFIFWGGGPEKDKRVEEILPGLLVQTSLRPTVHLRLTVGYADVLNGETFVSEWVNPDTGEIEGRDTINALTMIPIDGLLLYYIGRGNVRFYGGAGVGVVIAMGEGTSEDLIRGGTWDMFERTPYTLSLVGSAGLHLNFRIFTLFGGIGFRVPLGHLPFPGDMEPGMTAKGGVMIRF
ncbi:MAG: hypothetical protein ACE5JP_08885 [Candidatus Bipolaricaulia bacterium]